eukprot:g880.t1
MASSADAFLGSLSVDAQFHPVTVLAGDDVTEVVTRVAKRIQVGDGLQQRDERVVVSCAGVLRYRPPARYWVEHNQRRYVPLAEHFVVGTVEARSADFYRVDIGGPAAALLPTLAFDGASKRNRPNLQVGDQVYARVAMALRGVEPELSCCVVNGTKKDWMTGDATFGELRGGYGITCSVAYARQLLRPDNPVLTAIGKCAPFEAAIGHNGRVWVNAASAKHVVFVANALRNAEQLSAEQAGVMVARLWSTVSKRLRTGGDRQGGSDSDDDDDNDVE